MDISKLVIGFKEAILWANGMEELSIHNFSDCDNQIIDDVVNEFIGLLNDEELAECKNDPEQFGHWLALTSGNHGAGFFDSGNPIVSGIDSKLDDITRHEAPYVDDGIIYIDFYNYGAK